VSEAEDPGRRVRTALNDEPHETAQRYAATFSDVDAVAVEVNLALVRSANVSGKAMRRRLEPLGFGLNSPRYLVLRTLYISDDKRLPLSEIARRLGVSSTNLTTLIDVLERDGWVTRVTNENDRRVTYAQLTVEGRERCEVMLPKMFAVMAELVSDISRDDQVKLIEILTRLRAKADALNQD
jgi:MarR family 2-MHQ and catechol resistance regulon transcriptional repressor